MPPMSLGRTTCLRGMVFSRGRSASGRLRSSPSWGAYMGIVTNGMSAKWEGLTHVELYSGPEFLVVAGRAAPRAVIPGVRTPGRLARSGRRRRRLFDRLGEPGDRVVVR